MARRKGRKVSKATSPQASIRKMKQSADALARKIASATKKFSRGA